MWNLLCRVAAPSAPSWSLAVSFWRCVWSKVKLGYVRVRQLITLWNVFCCQSDWWPLPWDNGQFWFCIKLWVKYFKIKERCLSWVYSCNLSQTRKECSHVLPRVAVMHLLSSLGRQVLQCLPVYCICMVVVTESLLHISDRKWILIFALTGSLISPLLVWEQGWFE